MGWSSKVGQGIVYIVLQIAEKQAKLEADWSAGWGVLVIRKREGIEGWGRGRRVLDGIGRDMGGMG